jgi:hypothetical protein
MYCTLQRFKARCNHTLGINELQSHLETSSLVEVFKKKLHSFLEVTTSMMHLYMLYITKTHLHNIVKSWHPYTSKINRIQQNAYNVGRDDI